MLIFFVLNFQLFLICNLVSVSPTGMVMDVPGLGQERYQNFEGVGKTVFYWSLLFLVILFYFLSFPGIFCYFKLFSVIFIFTALFKTVPFVISANLTVIR